VVVGPSSRLEACSCALSWTVSVSELRVEACDLDVVGEAAVAKDGLSPASSRGRVLVPLLDSFTSLRS
jgi:hypothetical protein